MRSVTRPFVLILAVATAITTTKGTVEIVYPPYLAAYGQSLSAIGVLTSLLGVAQLVSRVPVGLAYHADRAARQFAAALVVFALTTGAFSFANGDVLAVTLLTLLHGLAFGSVGTLGLAIAIDVTGGRSAGVSMAWYTAAISLGYALGSIVGGWLADVIGLAATMGAVAVLPLVAAIAVLALPRIQGATYVPDRGSGWRGLLAAGSRLDGRVWLAVATVVFINLIWDSLDTFFVIFAPTVGISLAVVGLLRALKSGAGLAIRLSGALVLRFADYRYVTLAGVVLAAAMMVVLPLSSSLLALIPIFIALGLSRGILRATSAATIAELRAEGRDVGLASGVYNAGLDIGSIAGPTLGGAVATAVGIPAMFQVVGLVGFGVWLSVALSSARTRQAAGLGGSNVIPLRKAPEN
jgi:predicted MFS family arabinose efflux permease